MWIIRWAPKLLQETCSHPNSHIWAPNYNYITLNPLHIKFVEFLLLKLAKLFPILAWFGFYSPSFFKVYDHLVTCHSVDSSIKKNDSHLWKFFNIVLPTSRSCIAVIGESLLEKCLNILAPLPGQKWNNGELPSLRSYFYFISLNGPWFLDNLTIFQPPVKIWA